MILGAGDGCGDEPHADSIADFAESAVVSYNFAMDGNLSLYRLGNQITAPMAVLGAALIALTLATAACAPPAGIAPPPVSAAIDPPAASAATNDSGELAKSPESNESPESKNPPEEPNDPVITHGLSRDLQPIADDLSRDPQLTANDLSRGPQSPADDIWALAERAEAAPAQHAAALLLTAIADAIEWNHLEAAQTLITRLQSQLMSEPQLHQMKLRQARLAQAHAQHARAMGLLRLLEFSPALDAPTSAELWRLMADSQQALGRDGEAAASLLRRDRWLPPRQRRANQRRLLALMDSLDPLSLLLLREGAPDNATRGWVALGEILRMESPSERGLAIQRWRALHRDHPVDAQLLNQPLLNQQLLAGAATPYQRIALLLPLTSSFGPSAQAFYEGFMAARSEDDLPRRAEVRLHDIGGDPSLAPLYYQAAIAGGADFVVGPLGRRAVGALIEGAPTALPTLLIGEVPAAQAAPDLYGISLSPQQEARQAAERAFADGHRQAAVFRGDSEWGGRVAAAFAARWESLGGALADDTSFPLGISDYSSIIQKLLGLDESRARARVLEAELKFKLEFTPRRRDDLDFLFLAATTDHARLLTPQLRFFQAHDLALYATSYVYSGKPDPAIDADLDGIVFGDMDWILGAAVLPETEPAAALAGALDAALGDESNGELTAATPRTEASQSADSPPDAAADLASATDAEAVIEAAPAPKPVAFFADMMNLADLIEPTSIDSPVSAESAPAQPASDRESSPYHHTGLDRLYALGLESYQLIPALAALRSDPSQRYFGQAVDISVQADGNAWRHLAWARFEHGLPMPLPSIIGDVPAPIQPAPAPVQ